MKPQYTIIHIFILGLQVRLFTSTLNIRANEELESNEAPIEEVFLTELVYAQEKGAIQFTLAPQLSKGAETDISQLDMVLEYGITDQWQVEMQWSPYIDARFDDQSNSGTGDLNIGSKYTWMNIANNLHVAIALEIQYPTADIDDGLTEGFIEYEPSIILAKDFPELSNLQLFLQSGFSFVNRTKQSVDDNEAEPEAHAFNLNLGFFLPLEPFAWTTELSWSTNTWNNNGEENTLYLTPGIVWEIEDVLEVGIGVPIGLNTESDNFQLIAMFILEWD